MSGKIPPEVEVSVCRSNLLVTAAADRSGEEGEGAETECRRSQILITKGISIIALPSMFRQKDWAARAELACL